MAERDQGAAIVGMACMFPGAPDLESYRRNLEAGVDAISDVPVSRWDPVYYDPRSAAPDRIYCRRGGFLADDTAFDATSFGVMPVAAEGGEPDQMLALETASRAVADAGYDPARLPRERTAVILGRGAYMGPGMVRTNQHVRTTQQLVECLRGLLPGLSDERLEAVREEFRSELGRFGPDTAIGLVPNLAASRIANRMDLHGPAYTIDAACASSLVAVDQGCRQLASGSCDVVLAGGVHICHDVTFWSVFCQLGALSRTEQIRPFDRRADGLLVGEGIGIVLLKREADARRDGDRIYAVIRGSGVASDGRESSLMQPRVEGQLLALERAWKAADLDPRTVGLLEAHGTGTPSGDAAELRGLARFFGEGMQGRPGIGSVKSMIGHTMPAAGAAGLIKSALAIYHGVLPPTLHCEEPHELMAATGFRPVVEAETWKSGGVPRRAGVNAFGFGGINTHVVLESTANGKRRAGRPVATTGRTTAETMLLLAAETPADLIVALGERRVEPGAGPCRLALLDPTPERMAKARRIVARGSACRLEREGLWFTPDGLVGGGGKTAFLFPGVDANFEPRVDDVARRFELPVPAHTDASNLEEVGLGIIGVGRLLDEVLRRSNIHPDAIAGHSIGEWTGMIAAGMISDESADELVAKLSPGTLEVPGVVFAAVGCGADRAARALEGLDDIGVSHDNCPHQIILCGREESVDTAIGRLLPDGVLCQKLPFRSGFHSHLFRDYVEPHRANFHSLSLQSASVPLWSATTCEPYPSGPEEIASLVIEHLVRPVRFRELVEKLWAEGVRAFVQVGCGRLAGFVGDTLRGREHVVLSANVPARTGLEQLRRTAGALWAEGVPVDFDRLDVERNPQRAATGRPIVLQLGSPLARLKTPLDSGADQPPELPEGAASDPVMAEFAATLREIDSSRREVLRAWQRAAGSTPARPAVSEEKARAITRKLPLSVARFPYLIDHCFYPQPEGWPELADRFPVVPMTTAVSMMTDLARELVPGLVPVAVERIRAYQWIAAEPPVELELTASFDGADRVDVTIEGYASATVRFAADFPPPPVAEPLRLEEEREAPVAAERFYVDRFMFHGPSFQGVRDLGRVGRNGIRGIVESLPTQGALLDNAGQLFGFWVTLYADRDRIIFPFKVDRMAFYGPPPAVGRRLECNVDVTDVSEQSVRADIDLNMDGRLWARLTGWESRRFETDPRLWEMLRFPETQVYALPRDGGYCIAHEPWRTTASRDLLSRRYLGSRERARYASMDPRRQRRWLLECIAVKDAVRQWLWDRGAGPLFPIEIEVDHDGGTNPAVSGPFAEDLRVAVAHEGRTAVARVELGADPSITIRCLAGELRLEDERWTGTRQEGGQVVAWTRGGVNLD